MKTPLPHKPHQLPGTSPGGYTFPEIIITLAIGALVLLLIGAFISNTQTSQRDGTRRSEGGRIASAIDMYARNHGGEHPQDLEANRAPLDPRTAYLPESMANKWSVVDSCDDVAVGPQDHYLEYATSSDRRAYRLSVCLEQGTLAHIRGANVATGDGDDSGGEDDSGGDDGSGDDENEDEPPEEETVIIGEAGRFLTPGNDAWTTINFENTYSEPVVVGTSNSHNGGQKALVFEARNVGSNSAEMRICEGEGSVEEGCDTHKQEYIGYLVIDAAETETVEGIEAGTFDIDSEMDNNDQTVNYPHETFDSQPVVLTAPHTSHGVSPVETRSWDINTSSFLSGICQQKLGDQHNCDKEHVEETVGWVAMTPGSDTFEELSEVNSTGKIAEHSEPVNVSFSPDFSQAPAVVVEQQTLEGGQESEVDEAYDITASGGKVRYCEMYDDRDNCHTHLAEDIGWLAVETGVLNAQVATE